MRAWFVERRSPAFDASMHRGDSNEGQRITAIDSERTQSTFLLQYIHLKQIRIMLSLNAELQSHSL